jgi:signal transduction histidine kinase
VDLFDKARNDMEAEVKKSFKWVVLTAIVGIVLMTLYVMVK